MKKVGKKCLYRFGCHEVKARKDFSPRSDNPKYVRSWCKECEVLDINRRRNLKKP